MHANITLSIGRVPLLGVGVDDDDDDDADALTAVVVPAWAGPPPPPPPPPPRLFEFPKPAVLSCYSRHSHHNS